MGIGAIVATKKHAMAKDGLNWFFDILSFVIVVFIVGGIAWLLNPQIFTRACSVLPNTLQGILACR
jgi:hypothetical protein